MENWQNLPHLSKDEMILFTIIPHFEMGKNFTPLSQIAGFTALFLLVTSMDAGAQCNSINQVSFAPADTVHCGFPLNLDFQGAISVDSTPVLLGTQTSSANFKSAFSFSFPTQNNGCYYYLEIEGVFTLWSNTDDFYDAYGLFDISTNQLISPGVSNKLSITPPLFISPNAFSTSHIYRYYYQGNGSNVTVSFSDNQLSDNSGSMTFKWHVVPCFSTLWELGDGATATETDVSHTYASPGTYPVTLTVTDELAGCSESFSGSVSVLPLAATSLSATICAGESYAVGNSVYTATGAYTDVLTTYLGCDSIVSLDLLVLNPVASVLSPATIDCDNPTVALNGSGSSSGPGVTYLWTGPAPGCIIGNASQASVAASCPGTYTLSVIQTAADGTQCQASAQVTVLEDTETPVIQLDATADFPCEASEMALTAVVTSSGTNLAYSWQTATGTILSGANGPVLTIGSPGVYQLTVTNQDNGCSASAQTVVTGALPMDIGWEVKAPTCLDPEGSISISVLSGGNAPFLYSIDGGSQFQNESLFTGLDAGQYGIVVQDAKGCETDLEIVIIEPLTPVDVQAGAGASIHAGESWPLNATINLSLSRIDSILWTPAASLSCADCLNTLASPVTTTDYLVEVWDVNGCYDSASVRIVVLSSGVYAPNVFSPNGDGINDIFMLFGKSKDAATVRSFKVFSKWGQLVYEGREFPVNNPAYGWDGSYEGRQMGPGAYAWFAEIGYPDGRAEVLKGGVTLLR
jgi:gliding motility-associated-like protein